MKWITRERPKIDRIACQWLILWFIDPHEITRCCAMGLSCMTLSMLGAPSCKTKRTPGHPPATYWLPRS